MTKKFVKLLVGEFVNETRDLREINCIKEIGTMDIVVVAKGEKNSILSHDFYELHTRITRPLRILSNSINQFISFWLWVRYIRTLNADIISAHDIIALGIAYCSSLFSASHPKLIYDSHEFEMGRNSDRSKSLSFLIRYLERFLMKKCAFSIMVNDTIADEVQRIHKLKVRPLVIRSVQEYIEVDSNLIREQRKVFSKRFNFESDDFLVMYHGAIMDGRGIENIIQALGRVSGVKCVILGFGEESYLEHLKKMIFELNLQTKIFFHPAVPHSELWKLVGAADAGIVMLDNICLNHYYSLPNKFFQNIQAHTPIIGSDFPEVKRLIDKYKIGVICKPGDPDLLAKTILKLKDDKGAYKTYKENLLSASKELCWENEKVILMNAYRRIL